MRKSNLINTLKSRVDAVLFDSRDYKDQWSLIPPSFNDIPKGHDYLIEVYCELDWNASGPNAIRFAENIDGQIMYDTYIMHIPRIILWDIKTETVIKGYYGSNKLGYYILKQIHDKMNPDTNWKQVDEWTDFRNDCFTLEYYI